MHTSAGVQADWGSSLMTGLESMLTKLEECGLHSLEQRGLRKGDRCDCSY